MAEDNLADALVVREAIRMDNLPLDLHVVTDGELAIDFVGRAETDPEAPSPDVVFLDINLPKIDGFEVLKRIRQSEKYRKLPAIMITSSDSPADRNEAIALGASYFRKPPNYQEFLKVGRALGQLLTESGLL